MGSWEYPNLSPSQTEVQVFGHAICDWCLKWAHSWRTDPFNMWVCVNSKEFVSELRWIVGYQFLWESWRCDVRRRQQNLQWPKHIQWKEEDVLAHWKGSKLEPAMLNLAAQMCREGWVPCYHFSPLLFLSARSHSESPQRSTHIFQPSRKQAAFYPVLLQSPQVYTDWANLDYRLILKPIFVSGTDYAVWPMLGHNPTLKTLFTCTPRTETKVRWSVSKRFNAVNQQRRKWVIGKQEQRGFNYRKW